jgi:hypothetical protein
VHEAKNPPTTSRTSPNSAVNQNTRERKHIVLSRPITPRVQPLVDAVGRG